MHKPPHSDPAARMMAAAAMAKAASLQKELDDQRIFNLMTAAEGSTQGHVRCGNCGSEKTVALTAASRMGVDVERLLPNEFREAEAPRYAYVRVLYWLMIPGVLIVFVMVRAALNRWAGERFAEQWMGWISLGLWALWALLVVSCEAEVKRIKPKAAAWQAARSRCIERDWVCFRCGNHFEPGSQNMLKQTVPGSLQIAP